MKPYASDLSDAEWTFLAPLIPPAKAGGRPRSVNMRQILNGIFYVLRSGGAWRLLEPVKGQFPRMEKVWVDQGYTGKGKTWIETHMGWTVEVVERSPRRGWIMTQDQGLVKVSLPKTFEHLPRRWVVERTIAWIGRSRRLSKDYEYLTSSSEAMVYLTMLRLILTRLAKQNEPQFVKYKQTHAA